MNNNKFLDVITVASFLIGLYALYIALENLNENREQDDELKEILTYLEIHLQNQDEHLANQDKVLENIIK